MCIAEVEAGKSDRETRGPDTCERPLHARENAGNLVTFGQGVDHLPTFGRALADGWRTGEAER